MRKGIHPLLHWIDVITVRCVPSCIALCTVISSRLENLAFCAVRAICDKLEHQARSEHVILPHCRLRRGLCAAAGEVASAFR